MHKAAVGGVEQGQKALKCLRFVRVQPDDGKVNRPAKVDRPADRYKEALGLSPIRVDGRFDRQAVRRHEPVGVAGDDRGDFRLRSELQRGAGQHAGAADGEEVRHRR